MAKRLLHFDDSGGAEYTRVDAFSYDCNVYKMDDGYKVVEIPELDIRLITDKKIGTRDFKEDIAVRVTYIILKKWEEAEGEGEGEEESEIEIPVNLKFNYNKGNT